MASTVKTSTPASQATMTGAKDRGSLGIERLALRITLYVFMVANLARMCMGSPRDAIIPPSLLIAISLIALLATARRPS